MTKQLTPLEALEILKEANTIYCGCASNLFARYRYEIETIETALKALEIIKEKQVNIEFLFNFNVGAMTYEEYIELNKKLIITQISKKELSQEEFNLLKEVL